MSFLSRLSASQRHHIESWNVLTDIDELDQIVTDSQELPIVIFKHSVTCGISAGAKYRLESHWDLIHTELKFYYLDLLAYREISNKVVERWEVRHQSPQIIVIRNDKAVFDASHGSIDAARLEAVLSKIGS